MTRPYTRACRQTNFSEGGFVNKVPFLFFFFSFFSFSFSYLLSFFSNGFCPLSFFSSGSMASGGSIRLHRGDGYSILGLLFAKNNSILLNKVSTIAVKIIDQVC